MEHVQVVVRVIFQWNTQEGWCLIWDSGLWLLSHFLLLRLTVRNFRISLYDTTCLTLIKFQTIPNAILLRLAGLDLSCRCLFFLRLLHDSWCWLRRFNLFRALDLWRLLSRLNLCYARWERAELGHCLIYDCFGINMLRKNTVVFFKQRNQQINPIWTRFTNTSMLREHIHQCLIKIIWDSYRLIR